MKRVQVFVRPPHPTQVLDLRLRLAQLLFEADQLRLEASVRHGQLR
jgi:hypothetical protein